MRLSLDQFQSDRRRMKAYIGMLTPEPGTRVVIAEGEGDEVWTELYPLWDEEDGWDLYWETNCKEAVGLLEIYQHLRRQERTLWEWERELAGETARLRVQALEEEVTSLRKELDHPAGCNQPVADWAGDEDEAGLPREVSTAEAAGILGISKDTVLKLKTAGLLEYRNTASPDSFRPVFAFTLRSIMEIRTTYERDIPIPRRPKEPTRRAVRGKRKYKHLNLDD